MLLITTCPPMLAKFKPSLVKPTQHPSPCEMSSSLNRPDDAARIERERERERERDAEKIKIKKENFLKQIHAGLINA